MRVAVDALGGDNAPGEIVAGSLVAARKLPDDEIVLVGDETVIRPRLEGAPANVSLRDARGVVDMKEDPASALRARPDSSVAVAAGMVRTGEAEAFFSAGSTGAAVAAALLKVGRLEGCRRPAIATMLPFDRPVLLLDAGATVACRPQDLLNFAILGSVFAQRYLRIEDEPKVGLINVGEEPGKGDDLAREAHKLLARSDAVRFVGNVEGREIGHGVADILVTDGFTGNVVLKTAEGVAREILGMVREAVSSGVAARFAAGVLRPRLVAVRDRVDPENYGGSFLLGVRGSVVIGHGNSHARGIENALVGLSRAGSGLVQELAEALAAQKQATGDVV
ncbi:MAG: Phosphate:acyl-ACP acyltransferase PlsX (EC [uncultured Rubrobacteraceae bacterium]|uniref:Phosphate acyltransferase n=1 Tax=uncultured Rubrobacteraceae bacterium TaxID=349277 RepID=A0A6J4QRZ1_9ACTN|nr:MAG: Phosphate:acyl-ACP acyltransferase PlsX (EC [uncultured Rubrobacteraceae bacterium]